VWTRTVWTYTDGTTETGYSVGKIGNTGATGAAGVSVSSVTSYYCLVGTGASAPSAPTSNPPGSSWTLTEPSYQSSTELYRCDLTVMSDSSWSWGAVSKVASYTAVTALAGVASQTFTMASRSGKNNFWIRLGTATINSQGKIFQITLNVSKGNNGLPSQNASAVLQVQRGWTGGDVNHQFAISVDNSNWPQIQVMGIKTGTNDIELWVYNSVSTYLFGNYTIAGYRAAWVDQGTTQDDAPTGDQQQVAYNQSLKDVSDAAQQALTVANLATSMAQGLVTVSSTAPDVSQVGRVWIIPSADGTHVSGMKISNGSQWTSYAMMVEDLMVVGEDGTIRLKNGVVSAPNIKATSDLWTKILAVAGNATIGGNLLVNGAVDASKITASQELWAKLASFASVTTDMLLAGGARITGELLADIITLVTRLVAGDPDGTRTELNDLGLFIYRALLDGTVGLAARFGLSDEGDYLGILDAEGNSVAAISETGVGSFSAVDAGDSLIYQGAELADTIEQYSRGIARAEVASLSGFTLQMARQRGLIEMSFTAELGHMYAISVDPIRVAVGASYGSGQVVWRLRYTTGATSLTLDSTALASFAVTARASSFDTSVYLSRSNIQFDYSLFDENGELNVNVLLDVTTGGPTVEHKTAGVITVLDLGPNVDETGATSALLNARPDNNTGEVTTTQVTKKTYTKTVSGSWGRSFKIDGTTASGTLQNKAVQGYGGGSFRMSMIGFPSIISDLSGATVKKIEVYLYFEHWWNNSGGTASIGYHGATSAPSTWNGSYANLQRSGIPKPGGVWITLPSSTHASWKSGAYRGVTLRAPSDSTSSTYYGYANPGACKLRYTYVK
jgi:hypothetical protein